MNPPHPILFSAVRLLRARRGLSADNEPPQPESPPVCTIEHLLVARRKRHRGERRLWRDQSESSKTANGHKNEINLLTRIQRRFSVKKMTSRCLLYLIFQRRCESSRESRKILVFRESGMRTIREHRRADFSGQQKPAGTLSRRAIVSGPKRSNQASALSRLVKRENFREAVFLCSTPLATPRISSG